MRSPADRRALRRWAGRSLPALALAAIACGSSGDPDAGPPDGGPDVADAGVDLGQPDLGPFDAGPPDLGPFDAGPDAGPLPCSVAGCPGGEACVREVCVATCSADLSGWDDALGETLTPLTNFCRVAETQAVSRGGDGLVVLDVTSDSGSAPPDLVVSRWVARVGGVASPTEVGRATPMLSAAGAAFEVNGFAEISETGDALLFGYAEIGSPFEGEIFDVSLPDGDPAQRPVRANLAAAWLNNSRFLATATAVNEGVADDQMGVGIYVVNRLDETDNRLVVTGIGDIHQGLEVGPGWVLVAGITFGGSWPDGAEEGPRAFVLSRSSVQNAIVRDEVVSIFDGSGLTVGIFEVFDPFRPGDRSPLETEFFGLGNSRLVTFTRTAGLTAWTADYSRFSGMALSNGVTLSTGDTFTRAFEGGFSTLLLAHADGLLLVRED
ncbi:MAG: hypothetical protein ACFCGT_25450 [Sandaracinaceae bacterium]